MNQKLTLSKAERLKSKTTLEALFKEGNTIKCGSLVLLWQFQNPAVPSPVQVAFSVPKKIFRKATDRNKIKRRMRESYRINRSGLYELLIERNKQLALFFLYRNGEAMGHADLQDKIIVALARLEKEIKKELNNEKE